MKIKSIIFALVFVLLCQSMVFGEVLSDNTELNGEVGVEEVEIVEVIPENSVKYIEAVEEIVKTLNKRDSYYFEIVNPTDYIQYAKDLGVEIVDSEKAITRLEFAVLLNTLVEKVSHQSNYSTELMDIRNVYSDIEGLSDEEIMAVQTVFIEGLMGGKLVDLFDPNDYLTDVQLNFVLDRLAKGYSREKLFTIVDSCFKEEKRLQVLEKYGYEMDTVITNAEIVVFFESVNQKTEVKGEPAKVVTVKDTIELMNSIFVTPGTLFRYNSKENNYWYYAENTSFLSAEEWEYLNTHLDSEIKASEFFILYENVKNLEKDMLKLEGFDSWEKILEYSEKYLGFVYPMIKTNKDCFNYFLAFDSENFKIVPTQFARTIHECQHEEFLTIAGASFSRGKSSGIWGTWSISPHRDPKVFYYFDYINSVWVDSQMNTELPTTNIMAKHYPESVLKVGSIKHYAEGEDSSSNSLGIQGLLSEFCSFSLESKVQCVSYSLGMNSATFGSVDYDGYRKMELMVKDYLYYLELSNPELYADFMSDIDTVRMMNNIFKDMDKLEEIYPWQISYNCDKVLIEWENQFKDCVRQAVEELKLAQLEAEKIQVEGEKEQVEGLEGQEIVD